MAAPRWHPEPAVKLEPRDFKELSAAERDHMERYAKLRVMLDEEFFRADFFQAVRLLERMEKKRNPVGYFLPPGGEAIRFTAHATLSFPPSQLHELERGEDGQLRMAVHFMGLCASITILPLAYTEYMLLQLRDKDTAMRDFFDIFNHRMISLFYRGWEKYRFFIAYEKGEDRTGSGEAGEADSLTSRMMDVLGMGTKGLQHRNAVPDAALLAYSGLLGRHTRSAAGLKQILEDYFDVPVTIVQFAGTWRTLPQENRTVFADGGGASERLGVGTVVGSEVWDNHGRIRIRIGPLGYDQYVSFLPGSAAYRELEVWVRFYSSSQYEAEVQLILKRSEVPLCELGVRGRQEPRLGFATWLKLEKKISSFKEDPGDAVFLLS